MRQHGCGVKRMLHRIENVMNDTQWQSGIPFWMGLSVLIVLEIVLGVLIIHYVPYTEIDWVAYMQEVSGVMDGELDYMNLRGDTGPLVYPAGFVYVYGALHYLTDGGVNIRLAQYIFLLVYIVFIVVVLNVYRQSGKIPPWVFVLVCMSRRIHSIFVLRLFNDGVAMLFLYASIWCLTRDRYSIGCVLFSFGVSIKMNVLLFAPALLILLLQRFGWPGTICHLVICAIPQVLLGLPFLLSYPVSYISRAFELGRQFMYKWTVNWKCIPEELFLSRELAVGLLIMHLIYLWFFANYKWTAGNGGLWKLTTSMRKSVHSPKPSAASIVKIMFTCQFVGIVFCRSLHFQFYTWYYHTLPFLLWETNLPIMARLVILGAIEWVWNVFPANVVTSTVLHVCHGVLLVSLWFYSPSPNDKKKTKQS